ncbi:MAG TPA: DUF2059 domain-containing protein [Candidatus Kapabacteria bacterium]|jgi:hypothetical protein|nr:DUF2059 domain-containing protein [Ignavibacteria bacterium]HRE56911.1 DUF2059 domain-containing protein [Candidatus Kapabacteria bacterium]HRK58182.1 DUF2059 domain-containing protein [Candidatus Kapabacteria bacterium]
MKNILLSFLLFVCSIISTDTLYAQNKSADIKRIITLTKAEDYVRSFSKIMTQKLQSTFQDQFKNVKNKAQVNTFMTKVQREVSVMFDNILKNDMEDIFGKLFTDSEIKEILAFYESPTGKKLLNITNPLSQQITKLIEKKYTPQLTLTLQNEARKVTQSK